MNEKKALDTFGPSLPSKDAFDGQAKKKNKIIKKAKRGKKKAERKKKKAKGKLKIVQEKYRNLKQELDLQAQVYAGQTQLLRTEMELEMTKQMLLAILQQKEGSTLPFLSLGDGGYHE